MKQVYLKIGAKNEWAVIVCYDFSLLDFDDMAAIMDTFGLSKKNINKALRILSSYNTGMAISRDDIKMSVVFVSRTTSPDEFWSTLNHELYHCCTAIIDYYGEPYDKEPAAYLQGELMRQAVLEIAEPCR